jgi:hypothetical protein
MSYELRPFQEDAVRDLLGYVAQACDGYRAAGIRPAIGLTATTGAGKTVVASALIEASGARYPTTPSSTPSASTPTSQSATGWSATSSPRRSPPTRTRGSSSTRRRSAPARTARALR